MRNRTTTPSAPPAPNPHPRAPLLTHRKKSSVKNAPSRLQIPPLHSLTNNAPRNTRIAVCVRNAHQPRVPNPQPLHARERARTTGTLSSVPDEDLGRDHHLQ